jgi:hypothetical protein
MRGTIDIRLARKRGAKRLYPGGKALQRFLAYRGRRDPVLNDEVIGSIPVPKSARQKFFLSRRARQAGVVTKASIRRRRTPAAVKAFARSIAKAAQKAVVKRATARARGAARNAPSAAPQALVWQSLGLSRIPNGQTYGTNHIDVSGRVAAIAVDPSNPKHLLVGSAGGGIWESRDTGATWEPRTDQMPSLAIGSVVFDPSNPKRVYAGSGEGNFYGNLGAGFSQSTDGGTTWSVLASAPFVGVGFFRVVIDPNDSQVLYAATTGGLFKSSNRGSTWTVKRPVRCWGVSVDPSDGDAEVLAAFADGLYASSDAGNSFAAVPLPGAPAGVWTRLAVDRVGSTPDVAYVFGAAGTVAYLWRRMGSSWTRVANLPDGMNISEAWYDWYVVATPDKADQVFLGAIDAYRGTLKNDTWSWTNITTQGNNSIHPDPHCLAFSPNDSEILFAGSDGGAFRSSDSGASWTSLNAGLVITEIEYLASWTPFGSGLPNAMVVDLILHRQDRMLIGATRNRGAWAIQV